MTSFSRRAWHSVAARKRLFTGIACGLALLPLLPAELPPHTRGILAWDGGVLIYLVLAMQMFVSTPLEHIAHRAMRQQEGEWTIFAITVGAITASMAAILLEFSYGKSLPAAQGAPHIVLVVITLLLSWLMMQTTFALRYAHEYYAISHGRTDVDGGLIFPEEPRPDYLDFVYFAFVIGMTFQVSDVQISSRKLRRLATLHGLLSFLFNTVILALTVNIAAGLL
jgi:uncharacterized membrane protein